MREAYVIAKREFLERVRTKWFVAMTLIGPLLLVGLIVIPVLFAGRGFSGATVQVVDKSGQLAEPLAAALSLPPLSWKVSVVPAETSESELLDRIHHKKISGYLVLPSDVLTGGTPVYSGDNATNQTVEVLLSRLVPPVIERKRAALAGLTHAQVDSVLAPIFVKTRHTTGEAEGASGQAMFFLGYIIALILYMVITLYGINVMRSVVTEKTSRVVELMVAATKPRAMMAGKIAGVGGAGLAQISIWLVIGGVALAYREELLGLFGVHGGASALPTLSIGQIGVIGIFFALGFLFYSTMYAAVGAMVASEQDSQQAQMPVTIFLVIGMVSMTAITGDPRGSTSSILTQVPFWSPMLMPLRYLLGGATGGEVALSIGILAASIVVVSRAAAKIYRVGILMYGKRPGLSELVRWLRY